MYPNYKQQAIAALVNVFSHIVSTQNKNLFFDERGLVTLGENNWTDLLLSTRDVINIAKLVSDIPRSADPKTAIWELNEIFSIKELASKAEQYECDNPLHLLHTMINFYCVFKNTDSGRLKIKMEEGGMTAFLNGTFTCDVDCEPHIILEVSLRYLEEESDWWLTFKAIDTYGNEEVELTNEQLSPYDKKMIADWMINEARSEPNQ